MGKKGRNMLLCYLRLCFVYVFNLSILFLVCDSGKGELLHRYVNHVEA